MKTSKSGKIHIEKKEDEINIDYDGMNFDELKELLVMLGYAKPIEKAVVKEVPVKKEVIQNKNGEVVHYNMNDSSSDGTYYFQETENMDTTTEITDNSNTTAEVSVPAPEPKPEPTPEPVMKSVDGQIVVEP